MFTEYKRNLQTSVHDIPSYHQNHVVSGNASTQFDEQLLASITVHEMREPVHALQGFLNVLLEGRLGPLNDAQVDFLSTATQAVQRLARRVEDFRIVLCEQLPLNLNLRAVDLRERVSECFQEVRLLSEEHRVSLHLDVEGSHSFKPVCWADPDRVDQIVLNLLENAIRYATPGTTVNVTVRPTKSGAQAVIVQNDCDLEVVKNIDRWADNFWREEGVQRTVPGGMGLGLAVVNYLVRAHGGELQMHSSGKRVYIGFAFSSGSNRSADSFLSAESKKSSTSTLPEFRAISRSRGSSV